MCTHTQSLQNAQKKPFVAQYVGAGDIWQEHAGIPLQSAIKYQKLWETVGRPTQCCIWSTPEELSPIKRFQLLFLSLRQSFFPLLYMALKHYSATPGVASVSFISAISCSFVLDHVLSVVYISKRFKMHSPSSFEKLSLGWSQSQSKAAHNQHHLPHAPVVTNKRCVFLSSPILQPFTNTCNCRSRGQGIYWQHNSLPQKYIKNYNESSIHKYFGSP